MIFIVIPFIPGDTNVCIFGRQSTAIRFSSHYHFTKNNVGGKAASLQLLLVLVVSREPCSLGDHLVHHNYSLAITTLIESLEKKESSLLSAPSILGQPTKYVITGMNGYSVLVSCDNSCFVFLWVKEQMQPKQF